MTVFYGIDVGGDTLDEEVKCFDVIVYKLVKHLPSRAIFRHIPVAATETCRYVADCISMYIV